MRHICSSECIKNFYKSSTTKKKISQFFKWTKDLHGPFCRKDIQMSNKQMERFQTSVVIMEMQINAIIQYRFTYTRMVINKKTKNNMLATM